MVKKFVITEEELRDRIKYTITKYYTQDNENYLKTKEQTNNGEIEEYMKRTQKTEAEVQRHKHIFSERLERNRFCKFNDKLKCEQVDVCLPKLNNMETILFGDAMEEYGYPIEMRIGITEAEAKTYPMKTTIKYLCNTCNIPRDFICIGDGDGEMIGQYILIYIPIVCYKENVLNNIKKVMTLCGWYSAYENYGLDENGQMCYFLQYEAKHPPTPNEHKIKGGYIYIYQISPKKYMHKIMKQGFCPSDRSAVFNYPSHNYFFTSPNTDFAFYTNGFNRVKGTNEPYVLYTIDTRKFRDNIVFYIDDKLDGGIFTSENIPPSAIVDVKDIDLNKNS